MPDDTSLSSYLLGGGGLVAIGDGFPADRLKSAATFGGTAGRRLFTFHLTNAQAVTIA